MLGVSANPYYSSTFNGKHVVQGAGASFPNRLYQDATFAYRFVVNDSSVSYLSTGSGKGKCRIKSPEDECSDTLEPQQIDYAGSDSLLTDAEYEQYPDLQMYPVVGGAVVPIYNLENITRDDPPLVLDRETLARIFLQNITSWGAESIRRLNPELDRLGKLPDAAISVAVREDKSGTTEIFKKALARFSSEFSTRVGTSSKNDWAIKDPPILHHQRDTNAGVAAFVVATSNSIGYSVLGEALALKLQYASIVQGDSTVVASSQSVEFALLEKGLEFGNNGDQSDRLTADVQDAKGVFAWPITGYTYLIMRKNQVHGQPLDRLRSGAECENVKHTVAYWNWFLSDPLVRSLAARHGFAPIPDAVTNIVLSRLNADVLCNGKHASLSEDNALRTVQVSGNSTMVVEKVMSLFTEAYSRVAPTTQIHNSLTPETHQITGITAGDASSDYIAVV
ncbi:hypothetical protein CYMTET_10291, partial [Cymbomonas tetramitiformis]